MTLRLPLSLLPLLVICACKPQPPAAPEQASPARVRSQVAEPPGPRLRTFPGLISADRSVEVAFEVGGVVQDVFAGTGDRVVAGQELAKLDARDFESRLTAAVAESRRAGADAQRAITLLEQNAIAPARVDALRAAAEAAASAVEQAEKALQDTTVLAPFSGLVAARFADPSESVQAKAVVFRIQDLSSLTVAIDLPQSLVLASQLRRIEDVTESLFTAHFHDPGARPEGYALAVSSFSADPDPRTGTYRFEMKLTPPQDVLVLPGMSCTVRIQLSDTLAAVVVPPEAVVTNERQESIAWIIDDAGTAQPIVVAVGEITSDGLIILNGLKPGDQVITAGLNHLTPGRPVRSL